MGVLVLVLVVFGGVGGGPALVPWTLWRIIYVCVDAGIIVHPWGTWEMTCTRDDRHIRSMTWCFTYIHHRIEELQSVRRGPVVKANPRLGNVVSAKTVASSVGGSGDYVFGFRLYA